MSNIIRIKTVAEAHKFMNLEKPKHPLVSVFQHTSDMITNFGDVRIVGDLYFISLKDGIKGSLVYGRSTYDFEEGTMVFTAPGQVVVPQNEVQIDSRGWSILFHPDLIRKSELIRTIDNYTFFGYEVNEALHVSEREKQTLTELVHKIELEIEQNMDRHTQKLIVSNIELMLDYCTRYYDRQFYTRTNVNKDIVSRFEDLLKTYFKAEKQRELGIPSVRYCGEELFMSPNYLSDLLKKETGRTAQDHIHSFIVEKAKTILLNSGESITQVAFDLGFEYSQHFSKLFKIKTGMSPKEYRKIN